MRVLARLALIAVGCLLGWAAQPMYVRAVGYQFHPPYGGDLPWLIPAGILSILGLMLILAGLGYKFRR